MTPAMASGLAVPSSADKFGDPQPSASSRDDFQRHSDSLALRRRSLPVWYLTRWRPMC